MKTSKQRIIVLLAFVLALGIGTQAFAVDEVAIEESLIVNDSLKDQSQEIEQATVDGTGSSANNGSAVLNTDLSDNQDVQTKGTAANDDSTAVAVNDTLNGNTTDTNNNNDDQDVQTKGTAANDDSTAVAVNDSLNGNKFGSDNDNSNQDNSENKTQVAVGIKDSLNDNSSNQDNSENKTLDSYNDTANADGDGTAIVDSEEVLIIKDALNGNIGEVEGGTAATNGAIATSTDSHNQDNSLNLSAQTGGVAIASDKEVDVEVTQDSNNNTASNGSAAVSDGGEATVGSYNKTNSYNTDTSFTVGNITVEVASSVLAGEVSGNSMFAPDVPTGIVTGANTISSDMTPTGIFVMSQNTGIQAQVQQAVTVQYNQ